MPGFLVTTSRAPSPRTRSFVKDLTAILPGATRVNRGHMTLGDLAVSALARGLDRVVVVGERRGNPSIVRVYEPARHYRGAPSPLRNIVTLILAGVTLSREAGRPQPSGASRLIVRDPGDPWLDDFVEAWLRGFHAALEPGGASRRDVVVVLRRVGGLAVAEFEQAGSPVGPRLRLRRPQRMLKGPGEGWLPWLG